VQKYAALCCIYLICAKLTETQTLRTNFATEQTVKKADFYARQLYGQVLPRARISYGDSVCPSVCPSVRLYGSRSPPYERIKFGYALENVRFLLLSTNLARERLQIDRLSAYHNKHC